jgi:hypothetical protein
MIWIKVTNIIKPCLYVKHSIPVWYSSQVRISTSRSIIPVLVDFFLSPSRRYRLCGLVVRVSGYRARGPGFDSWRFQIFCEAAGLERGPLSLVWTTEELLEGKSGCSGLENRD